MSDDAKSNFDKPIVYKKGQVIFAEGEPANYVYLVNYGQVTIFKEDNQRLLPIAEVRDKDFLGETSLFIDEVRTATAVATEVTEVLIIKKSEVKNVLRHCPEWVSDIMSTLSERLNHCNEILREHRILTEEMQNKSEMNPQEMGKIRQAIEDYRSRRGLK